MISLCYLYGFMPNFYHSMKEDYLRWLERARRDLHAALFNFRGSEFETAAFLCKQTAEKALKAVYIKKHEKLIKIHDLVALSREVSAPAYLIDYCKELSPVYAYSRYPDLAQAAD